MIGDGNRAEFYPKNNIFFRFSNHALHFTLCERFQPLLWPDFDPKSGFLENWVVLIRSRAECPGNRAHRRISVLQKRDS